MLSLLYVGSRNKGGGLHKNIKPKTNQWLVHSKNKLSSFLHLQIQKKKQTSLRNNFFFKDGINKICVYIDE